MYEHFLEFHVGHWEDLFVGYCVTNKNIKSKIQKMIDDRNKFYQFKYDIEVDKNHSCDAASKLTKSYLKKRYPKIYFTDSLYSDAFEFSIKSFVNEVIGFNRGQTFIIEPFVLDED